MTATQEFGAPQGCRPIAVVTGASTGIGLELARLCADSGHDLVIAADRHIDDAADDLRSRGANVQSVQADLSTLEGVDLVVGCLAGRPVEILMANAGHGLGRAFLEQEFSAARHVVDTNITGTIYLIQQIARDMVSRNSGRILITGSTAGFVPGSFQAVYNGTKAFIDSFSWALRNELKDSGVTVTCLMPGVTDTQFFARADLLDTDIGTTDKKMSPSKVAAIGFRAMMEGEGDVIAGLRNKLQVAMAALTPAAMLAEQHRKQTQPGSAKR